MPRINSEEILQLLEQPVADRRPIVRRIKKEAHVADLVSALSKAETRLTRQILCDILGDRKAQRAVATLIECLYDEEPKVRASAGDALAKIGNINAGKPILERYLVESDIGVKRMLAAALGAVKYEAAVPVLVKALRDSDAALRGCAAWSLGALRTEEAESTLSKHLEVEKDSYARERMIIALEEVRRKKMSQTIL